MAYEELSVLMGLTAKLPLLTTNLDVKNVNYTTGELAEFRHAHSFHEIYFMLDGYASFSVDRNQVMLKSGDLLYLRPNVQHMLRPDPAQHCCCLGLSFELNGEVVQPLHTNPIFQKFMEDEQYLLNVLTEPRFRISSDQCGCRSEVDSLCECLRLHYMAGLVKIYSCIRSFFIASAQSLTGLRSRDDFDNFSIGIINHAERIRLFMCENCFLQLTLQDVSDALFYSKRQIQRIIFDHYGITFVDMLAYCRVEKAKQLLQTTDLPLDRISEMCGFGGYQNMRKHFNAVERCPPATFRKKSNSCSQM